MNLIHLGDATPQAYRETRMKLLLAADKLTREIHRLETESVDSSCMSETLELERQRTLVIGMIASCSYVIEWLESGRRPGNRRGIERRSGSQREVLTDPSMLAALRSAEPRDGSPLNGGLGLVEREKLQQALRGLTERERDCYALSHGEGFSMAEAAQLLGISKSSVNTYLIRAERKIAMNMNKEGSNCAG